MNTREVTVLLNRGGYPLSARVRVPSHLHNPLARAIVIAIDHWRKEGLLVGRTDKFVKDRAVAICDHDMSTVYTSMLNGELLRAAVIDG